MHNQYMNEGKLTLEIYILKHVSFFVYSTDWSFLFPESKVNMSPQL